MWQVPYIASSFGGVKLGTNGHKDMFDWVTIQLTKLNDQHDVVQLLTTIYCFFTTLKSKYASENVVRYSYFSRFLYFTICDESIVHTKSLGQLHVQWD